MSNDPVSEEESTSGSEHENLIEDQPPTLEQPTDETEPQRSRRVILFASFLRVVGWLLIVIWALPSLLTLLIWVEILMGWGSGGPGFSGSAAAMGSGIVMEACIVVSLTLLPIGLVLLYFARLLRTGGNIWCPVEFILAGVGVILAGAGAILFVVAQLVLLPTIIFAIAATSGSAIIWAELESRRGTIATILILVVGIAFTALRMFLR